MKKKTTSQQLYIIFGVVIALLVGLIGYFAYLLMAPSDQPDQANTNVTAQVTNTNTNTNKETKNKKKTNANTNGIAEDTDQTEDTETNVNEGLVEPETGIAEDTEGIAEKTEEESEDAEKEDDDKTVVAGEGEQVVTLYFPKTASDCGEVFPVKRAITPTEDLYGQLILASMAGPNDEEDGYTTAAGSIRLRRVEYTSAGPTIYVDEAYDALSSCDQQTTEAQLVETANAMFDLPEGTSGEVIVGYPEDEDEIAEETEEDSEDAE